VTTSAPPDTIAPTVPTGLTTSNVTGTSFIVRWASSTDSVGVTGYNVYLNGVYLKTVTNAATTITGMANITSYSISVQAVDMMKNRSATSSPMIVTTLDSTKPTAPSNLVSSNVTTTSVRVTWTAPTDNVGVSFYNVYRNGAYVATVSGATTRYNFVGLTAGSSYNLSVRAIDALKNFANSTPLSVTTIQ
jgi:chitodextrinase